MFLVAVNKEGLFFNRIDEYLDLDSVPMARKCTLKFTKFSTGATEFDSELLHISRKDDAWEPLFQAVDNNELAFVPHPDLVFECLVGGVAMYSKVSAVLPSHRFERSQMSDWQWEILDPLYTAADNLDRAACAQAALLDEDSELVNSMTREYERLNNSIWRLHYDFNLLTEHSGCCARWEYKIGDTLFF